MSKDARAEEVRAVVAATRAAGTVAYTHGIAMEFAFLRDEMGLPDRPSDGSLRGDLWRAARGLGKVAAKGAGAVWKLGQFPNIATHGVLDLDARRFTVSAGSYHQIADRSGARDAASGGEWADTTGPFDQRSERSPLRLLDSLAGAASATEAGADEVRGVACHRLDVRVDLAVASRETPGGVAAPSVPLFEHLLALPFTVWLGDGHVRRVVRRDGLSTQTLELFDHGAPIDPAVWKRPPPRDR